MNINEKEIYNWYIDYVKECNYNLSSQEIKDSFDKILKGFYDWDYPEKDIYNLKSDLSIDAGSLDALKKTRYELDKIHREYSSLLEYFKKK